MGYRAVVQMDQTEPPHSSLLWRVREGREDANLDRRLRLSDRGRHQKRTGARRLPLHIPTDLSVHAFEKIQLSRAFQGQDDTNSDKPISNKLNLFGN